MISRSSIPEDTLGADLVWWRTAGGMRTVVSVLWGSYAAFPQDVVAQCILFDNAGAEAGNWRIALTRDKPLVIDSNSDGPWQAALVGDGILALYVCSVLPTLDESRNRFERLYTVVDWLSNAGDLATLHSDQVIRRGLSRTQRFTEIVILESEREKNFLLILNGESVQKSRSVTLELLNHAGETRHAIYPQQMQPFTVHRLRLAELVEDLVKFGAAQPITISGSFASDGLFSRPYVVTEGEHLSAYHAGDLYFWESRPFVTHALIGGEVNPMAVVSDESLSTVVNVLHSHGRLENDVWVDAKVFDLSGVLVAQRDRWLLARRNSLSRADVSELLPEPRRPFVGHVALSFSPDPGTEVPGRLQALLEYRGKSATARVMAWSDEWNSRIKMAKRRKEAPLLASYFRVWWDGMVQSYLSITNPGHAGYKGIAEGTLRLLNAAGESIECSFTLSPYATRFGPLVDFFPMADEFLTPNGIGFVVCESTSDLANVCFTLHRVSGVWSAEHFMPMETIHNGELVSPAGS